MVIFTLFFFAGAFAVAALIDCERVDSGRGELAGDGFPGSTIAIALMVKQYAGAWVRCGEERDLEHGAIRRFQIGSARCCAWRWRWRLLRVNRIYRNGEEKYGESHPVS